MQTGGLVLAAPFEAARDEMEALQDDDVKAEDQMLTHQEIENAFRKIKKREVTPASRAAAEEHQQPCRARAGRGDHSGGRGGAQTVGREQEF